jgi:hypothetical protein
MTYVGQAKQLSEFIVDLPFSFVVDDAVTAQSRFQYRLRHGLSASVTLCVFLLKKMTLFQMASQKTRKKN